MGKRIDSLGYVGRKEASFIEAPVEPEPSDVRHVWKHLSDIDEALRIQGGAYKGLLRKLMPEGRRKVMGWSRETSDVPEIYHVNELVLKHLKISFERSRHMDRKEWQDTVTKELVARAVRHKEPDKRDLNRLTAYYKNAIGQLLKQGIFGPKHSKSYDDLLGRMQEYRTLRQERELCEASLEQAAENGRRAVLLGASAVRSVYRAATVVPVRPVIWAFAWYRSYDVMPEDVEYGRRLKPVYLAGVVTLGFSALKMWQMAKGYGGGYDFGDSALADAVSAVATPPDKPAIAVVPPQLPIEQPAVFSEAALTIDHGEGWTHQFKDMGLQYNDAVMDKVGPELMAKGYAYQAPDPGTGDMGWFMNYGDGKIDNETLQWLNKQAGGHS